jgi:N-acetylneuraminic acid mutarotase
MQAKKLHTATGVCIIGLVVAALVMPLVSPQASEPPAGPDPDMGWPAPVSEEYKVLQVASPTQRVDEDGAVSWTPEGTPGDETAGPDGSSGNSSLATGPVSATILPLTMPTPRHHLSAVFNPSNGKMYSFGGFHHPSPYIVYAGIYEFDIAASQVTFINNLPTPRLGTSAVFSPSRQKAYIFGGHDGETVFDDIVEFDPSTGNVRTLATALPGPRRFSAAAYVPDTNKAYVIGGSDYVSASSPGLRTIFEVDLDTFNVQNLGEVLPVGLHLCSAVYAPGTGKIYIFGGSNELNDAVADIVEFDPVTVQAVILPAQLPSARNSVAAMRASPSQYAYSLGGKSAAGSALSSIVELRTTSGEVAASAVSLPLSLYAAGAAYDTQQRRGYLLGGYVSSSQQTIIEIEFEVDLPFHQFLPVILRQ